MSLDLAIDALVSRVAHAAAAAVEERLDRRVDAATTNGEDGRVRWLSNEEAMGRLGLSRATLQRHRASGLLPYSKVGGRVYYRAEDLDALLRGGLSRAGVA